MEICPLAGWQCIPESLMLQVKTMQIQCKIELEVNIIWSEKENSFHTCNRVAWVESPCVVADKDLQARALGVSDFKALGAWLLGTQMEMIISPTWERIMSSKVDASTWDWSLELQDGFINWSRLCHSWSVVVWDLGSVCHRYHKTLQSRFLKQHGTQGQEQQRRWRRRHQHQNANAENK